MHALVLLSLLAAGPTPAATPMPTTAPTPAAATPVSPWGAPVSWSDGQRQRQAWADPGALVEVGWDEAGAQALRAVDSTATVLVERARVRVWTVRSSAEVLGALPASARGHFVRLYRDAPSPRAAERAATGGVTVFFAPGQAPKDAAAWAQAQGRTLSKRLGADGLLLEAAPGDEAFAVAAALARLPGVTFAAPNWWRVGHSR